MRQEHAVLHNAITRDHAASSGIEGVSEDFLGSVLAEYPECVDSAGYAGDWDNQTTQNVSTKHPALPPSALGACALHTHEQTGGPFDAVAHDMAGVLRAAEAEMKRIEVRGKLERYYHVRHIAAFALGLCVWRRHLGSATTIMRSLPSSRLFGLTDRAARRRAVLYVQAAP